MPILIEVTGMASETTPKRAAIYTRVSTEGQGEGASLTTQRNDCQRYCGARGLVCVAEFEDLQSGMRNDRVQYQDMLRQAQAGEFEVIVVWRMDRFGRDRLESGYQIRDLAYLGIRVDSATEPNDSPLLRDILAAIAEDESRRISLRVSANKRTRAEMGCWTGHAPWGYRSVPHDGGGRKLEPGEDAPVVAELFSRYLASNASLSSLREYVSGHAVTANRPITRGSIHKVLKNPVYAGVVCFGRFSRSKIIPKGKAEIAEGVFYAQGHHPAIVEQELFDKVQAKLETNRAKVGRKSQSPHLFRGLVFCQCGLRYTGKKVTRGVFYYCNRRSDQGGCESPSISEKRLREAVLTPIETLLASFKQDDVRAEVRRQLAARQNELEASADSAQADAAAKLARLEKRLRNWTELVGDGIMPRDEYAKLRAEIEPEIAELQKATQTRPRAPQVDVEGLFSMADALQSTPPDDAEWREILESTLSRITIVDGQIRVEWKPFIADLVKTVMGA